MIETPLLSGEAAVWSRTVCSYIYCALFYSYFLFDYSVACPVPKWDQPNGDRVMRESG